MKNNKNKILLETIYGDYLVAEPLITLINSSVVQRLKKISMRGPVEYVMPYNKFISRYDHSIGVLALLIKYGADTTTQIAGLLHDVSHTVFSHVGELVFNHSCHKDSYQDKIHEWFLKKQGLDVLLNELGFSLNDILHKSDRHRMLEQDLPDICVDRLEYNLYTAFVSGKIGKSDIKFILDNLIFKDEKWFFINIEAANKFSYISIQFTELEWASAWGLFVYKEFANALKRAVEIKLITLDDVHFSTDDIVLKKLKESKDKIILNNLDKVFNYKEYFEVGTENDHDKIMRGKFRGINPLIMVGNKLERLTDLDDKFKSEFYRVKRLMERGWYIKYR